MRVLDLTHRISPDMPVFPGDPQPHLTPLAAYEPDGFRETLLSLASHTGTHMDAPAHLLPGGATLDALPVHRFVGKALVVDCRASTAVISLDAVRRYGERAQRADFLLFRLDWDRYWGSAAYFGDYPCVDDGVVDFLLRTGKQGVGFDTPGPDPVRDPALPRHRRLLSSLVCIENLTGLGLCGDELFDFFALPLNQIDADGAPVRAVAFWP